MKTINQIITFFVLFILSPIGYSAEQTDWQQKVHKLEETIIDKVFPAQAKLSAYEIKTRYLGFEPNRASFDLPYPLCIKTFFEENSQEFTEEQQEEAVLKGETYTLISCFNITIPKTLTRSTTPVGSIQWNQAIEEFKSCIEEINKIPQERSRLIKTQIQKTLNKIENTTKASEYLR